MTIPLSLDDGTPFPARDLAIFLATGVIIVSLFLASIGLPILLKGLQMPAAPSHQAQEDKARVLTAKAAIRAVERVQHEMAEGRGDADIYPAAGAEIMDAYRERIDARSAPLEEREVEAQHGRIERELRLAALAAEREEVLKLVRAQQLGSELAQKMISEIDLAKVRYSEQLD